MAELFTPDDPGPEPFALLVDAEWQTLLEKDDRTSPAEYPEMCLLTRTELAGAMSEAFVFAKQDRPACGLCALGYAPFKAEGILWHQVNGRDPFRCGQP